jgi:glycosyltransferase involved in cell wall biosynthesis
VKFTIVTPTFNSARFLPETMASIASQQGDFSIEHIVVDNCSTDATTEIVREIDERIRSGRQPISCRSVDVSLISQPDNGMYEAINRGFAHATGDVYAYLNSDDIYLPGALATVARVFAEFPTCRWLKGITSYIDEHSTLFEAGELNLYDRGWLLDGAYGTDQYFVQQDSVFWRTDLHAAVGPFYEGPGTAGDYVQWMRFARETELVSIGALLSCFRVHPGQITDMANYLQQCDRMRPHGGIARRAAKRYFWLERRIPRRLRPALFRLCFPHRSFPVITREDDGRLRLERRSYYRVA